VRLLLDTHALIWWWLQDDRLSDRAREAIADPEVETFVSAISCYEIALKVGSGRLPAMVEPLSQFAEACEQDGLIQLAIRYDHARTAGLLPPTHRDPFDRMIAGQALTERLVVVTCDRAIAAFGCETLW
jgi:PIN domain nuclease of toxin-antitoxin system